MLCLGTVHRQREHVRAVERQPGPRVGSTRDLPAPQAREKLFSLSLLLLNHALKFTGKTLLLGVDNKIVPGKSLYLT